MHLTEEDWIGIFKRLWC